MIVIIEVEETDVHGTGASSSVNHLPQIGIYSDVLIQTAVGLTVELEHEDGLVIEIMPPPYQM